MSKLCLLLTAVITVILVTIGFYMILAKKKKDSSDSAYISMQLKGFGILILAIVINMVMLSMCMLPQVKMMGHNMGFF
jgi:hypothetical protein